MPVHVQRKGTVAVITLDHAPVNALSHPMRLELWNALEAADGDDEVRAIVITGAGGGFCGGGDLREMRTPLQQAWPGISDHLLPRIEACRKPVIAALHGFAVGGGLELALACHYRVAHRTARLALPEMKHGVVPPSGSQRMPRAIGVYRALSLIVLGEYVHAHTLAATSLFDRVVDDDPVAAAIACAKEHHSDSPVSAALLRHRELPRAEGDASIAAWRERLRQTPGATASMRYCIDAVEIAVRARSFDDGIVAAKRLHDQLAAAL
jgi:enoyl-CoA hydratase